MNYAKAQADLKDKYPPTAVYFHNYLFPHNEKRTYRNKLTLVDENVQYLGVTIKDKTNRHWQVTKPEPITIDVNIVIRCGKKYYQYYFNGTTEYAKNILHIRQHVGNATINFIDKRIAKTNEPKTIIKTPSEKPKRISKYEIYRQQFDKLPKGDKYCCYCEAELDRMSVTRDHIIPTNRGGLGVDYGHPNIKPCCTSCNSEKGNLMLHSYIQLLNYKLDDVIKGSQGYLKLQTKIRNANLLAKELSQKSPE